MKTYLFVITIAIGLINSLSGEEWYRRWEQAGSNWYESWMGMADQADSMTPDEKLYYLGRALRIGINKDLKPHQREVYERIQRIIIVIPGHAEYYRNKIYQAQAERKAAMGTGEMGPKTIDFDRERNLSLEVLANLPSHETVGVLGELLFDEWVCPVPIQDERLESPIAFYAMQALGRLPLAGKPTQPKSGYIAGENLYTWQLWFQQIRAGNRTFRFEGDPQEYNLQGPVSVAKVPVTNRPDKRPAALEPAAEKEVSGRLPIPALVAAALAVLTAGWYFLRARRKGTA